MGGDFYYVQGPSYFSAQGPMPPPWIPPRVPLQPFNAQLDLPVRAVALASGSVFLGGDFTQAGGQSRYGLAKLDASGNAQPWDAALAPGASVHALATSGSLLYAAGQL